MTDVAAAALLRGRALFIVAGFVEVLSFRRWCCPCNMSMQLPALFDALQLLDVGGSAAICSGAERVRARMLKWPCLQRAPSDTFQGNPIIPMLHDKYRSASLGLFAPLPDQVILSIFERLRSVDLHK